MLAQTDFGPTLEALTAALVVAGPVAVAVTKLVDFVRNLFDKADTAPSWAWNALAFAIGIALALGWGINLLGAIIATIPALAESNLGKGIGGTILSGLAIGGMAGAWHDKLAAYKEGYLPKPRTVV